MKLIEALKNLKTIDKRIAKNCEQIQQYAAWVSTETPVFETEEKQRAEVAALVQSNLDLSSEHLRLTRAIAFTNLNTSVTIHGHTFTITEIIALNGKVTPDNYGKKSKQPGAARFRFNTYAALSGAAAAQRMQSIYKGGIDAANPPKVILAYSEADKQKSLREWDEFVSQIDGRLEVVNAETELQGY